MRIVYTSMHAGRYIPRYGFVRRCPKCYRCALRHAMVQINHHQCVVVYIHVAHLGKRFIAEHLCINVE